MKHIAPVGGYPVSHSISYENRSVSHCPVFRVDRSIRDQVWWDGAGNPITRTTAAVPRKSNHHRLRRRARARNVDIHDDGCDVIDAMRSALGTLHGGMVTHMTRKFHDPVMYFDADRARNYILFLTKLSEDVVLNLHIVHHQPIPSLFIREAPSPTAI
jgi:hypothetical protein